MSRPIAFVLLETAATPNMPLLAETMRRRHPQLVWEIEPSAEGGRLPFIRCGQALAVVMAVGAPLPQDPDLWRRAAMTWPDAAQAAERHRAHLIVSLMGEDKGGLAEARLVTALAGGLVADTPGSCAVVWQSHTARSAEMWRDMSRTVFEPYPNYPVTLWMDIAPFRSGPSSIGAFTVGLAPFVGREIEFEVPGVSGAALLERVVGLATYLIEKGSVIADGDTIGESEAERIKVYHGTSRFDGSPVLVVGQTRPSGATQSFPIIPAALSRHPLLAMLARVGLYDPAGADNQVQLQPHTFDPEDRLESYDSGVAGWLSSLLAGDAYIAAEEKARAALALGDGAAAKAALTPFADSVRQFQDKARTAIRQGKLFMFAPKQQGSQGRR